MVMEHEIPIIEMRIRGLEREIVNAFMGHSDELRPLVGKAIEQHLTSENIQRIINDEVAKTIQDAIKNSISSREVREKIETLIKNMIIGHLGWHPARRRNEMSQM